MSLTRIANYSLAVLLALSALSCRSSSNDETIHIEDWVSIFNGENLNGWTPKFTGYEAGHNLNDIFRVSDGILHTNYADTDSFRGEFGHLFYETPYSYYKFRLQYRMVGEQLAGGPGWAFANNGMMLHCQDVATMSSGQGFPLSIEFQLLCGDGTEPRASGNLCTPGSHVTFEGALYEPHCMTNYEGPTFLRDTWIDAEAVVYGDSIIHQILAGDTVLTYTNPVVGGTLEGLDTIKFRSGTPMTQGYLALQAETHNTDFRNLEVLDLCGCMDKAASNYKSYYIKSKPESCVYD